MENSVIIPLTKGLFAIVDAEDAHLANFKWFAVGERGKEYAARNAPIGTNPRCIYMHRLILGITDGRKVDHEDGNKLNNRRYNLRPATHKENTRNLKLRSTNTTGFKGVVWNGYSYWAGITVDGKAIYLGSFKMDIIAAAEAYNTAALEHFGEFACLNEIPSG